MVLAGGLLPVVLAMPAWAADRVALVIGNAAYSHAPRLANPLNDAADIGAALERLGFAVTRLENADYAALRRGLLDFTRAASASEVALVFYAGHGIEVDRRNFLVPVDARLLSDADVEFETVPLELISRAVERARGAVAGDPRRLPREPVRGLDATCGRDARDRSRPRAHRAVG